MIKKFNIISVIVVLGLLSCSFTFAELVPIDGVLKALNADGSPTFDPSSTVGIVGVVTNVRGCLDGTNSFQYYIQDTGTGLGLQVYRNGAAAANPNYAEGDLMYVPTGNVANYAGIIEFVPVSGTTTEMTGTGYGYSTVICYGGITAANFFDQTAQSGGEYYDGRVFRLNNVYISSGSWPAPGANANMEISDASGGTLILRIDKDTQIPDDLSSAPTGTFDLVGWGTQYIGGSPYTSGYQITPRVATDFIDTTMVVVPASANVSVGGTKQFSATGALPPYIWSLSNPAIGSINSTTGLFTAGAAGSSNVIATDQIGRQGSASISVTATSAPLVSDLKQIENARQFPLGELFE